MSFTSTICQRDRIVRMNSHWKGTFSKRYEFLPKNWFCTIKVYLSQGFTHYSICSHILDFYGLYIHFTWSYATRNCLMYPHLCFIVWTVYTMYWLICIDRYGWFGCPELMKRALFIDPSNKAWYARFANQCENQFFPTKTFSVPVYGCSFGFWVSYLSPLG